MAKTEAPSNTVASQSRSLLDMNRVDDAMRLLERSRDTSGPTENARAVCLMRLGKAEAAVRLLNPLVFHRGSIAMNPDAPLSMKVNYATALLLAGNLSGCLATLDQLHEESHPSIERLRQAISAWRKRQSLWRRLLMVLGLTPDKIIVPLDFPPGEL